jgi:RimJ/RimL family protein N-acetyltransferase
VGHTPPYRIETERLVVRCWEPRDAQLLKEATDESVEHLRPWMDWAQDEPLPLDAKIELLRTFRSSFDLGTEFVYAIFARDESRVVGGSGLHPRAGDGSLEIGYWLRVSETGKGYMAEAVSALTQAAFTWCGVERVEIRIDPTNEASLKVARRLGYIEEGVLRRRRDRPTDGAAKGDVVVYSLLPGELKGSPAAAAAFAAYDAAGRVMTPPA